MANSNPLKKTLAIIPMVGIMVFNTINVNAELGDEILKEGVENKDVQVLQEHLINLNFLDLEETTTYYGEQTIEAVKQFQSFYGLNSDGAFGPNTFETLKKVTSIKPLEYERTLKLDMEGEDVKALQETLKILGFLNIDETDIVFGAKTKQAVEDFQKLYEIQVDGIAGSNTIESINQALNGSNRKRRPLASRGDISRSIDKNIIATARKYIGTPYRYGGTTSKGFDCSGFTQLVYAKNGIDVPRSTLGQAKIGSKLSKGELRTGDLVIFSNTYKSGPSHTGIYIGNGDFIHSSTSKGITISNINSSDYYRKHFSYGRRIY